MEIGWILTGFFIFVTLLFMAFAFFLPEWVGISGKKAREIMQEQQGDSENPPHSTSSSDSLTSGNSGKGS